MTNSARVGDIKIRWREEGEGFPLLLISGFGTTMEIWEQRAIDRLAERYRVIVFDNRGMGGTSAGEKEFTIRLFADDARGLMEAMGIERAHVLGWSMGSLIAQELALACPECIERLVLYASYTDWSYPPSPEIIERLSDPSGTPGDRGKRWIETLFPFQWLQDNEERVQEIFSKPLGVIPGDSIVRQQKAIENWEGAAGRIGALKAHTLLLCGEEDVLAPPENSRKMADLMPSTVLKVIPGSGHGLMFQDPDLFVSVVGDFLWGNTK